MINNYLTILLFFVLFNGFSQQTNEAITLNSGKGLLSYDFSSCQDLKCLKDAFARKSLRCSMESKCNGKEWAENLSQFIIATESLNLPFTSWKEALISNINTVKLHNAWGIYYFLESNLHEKYKKIVLSEVNEEQQDVLSQMQYYLDDGNLKISLPKDNVGFYTYNTYSNGYEIYKLDMREIELLKQFEAQSGIKQTNSKSKIDINKVLEKLIAPENRNAYWIKTEEGFEVYKMFGTSHSKAGIVNAINFGDYVIARDLVLGNQYILRNFKGAKANIKYEVHEYEINVNFWIKKENSALVYLNGEVIELDGNISFESPVDRIIKYQDKYYLLGDFKNRKENKLYVLADMSYDEYQLSKSEKAPKDGIYWKHYGEFYYVMKDGEYIDFEVEHTFRGDDVLIYHPPSYMTYILKDYKKFNDGKWRKAIPLKNTEAAWIKYEDNTFNCYEKATKVISKNKWSTENSNDLWIMDYNNKPKYVLKNYKEARTNTFLVAKRYGDLAPTNISNNVAVESKDFKDEIGVGSYSLKESEKAKILGCNDDNKCLTKVFDDKYRELKTLFSGDELVRKFADYALVFNDIKPGKLFGVFMTSDYATDSGIYQILPKEVMTDIREQAQNLAKDYNEYINSKETQDKIKKQD